MESMFSDIPESVVQSNRIIYTPSPFAKSSLLHLQEIGSLEAKKEHTSRRSNISSFLFFVVLSGSGELNYDGETFKLAAGSCVFVDCRQPYSHTTSSDLWSLRWCHFYGPMMTSVYKKYVERGGKPVFSPENVTKLNDVLDRLYETADSSDHIRDMRINEELNRLCTLLMEQSWHPENVSSAPKKMSVAEVKDYLDEHFAEKVTLDDLSKQFFINKYYLTRVFKEQYGQSISDYLTSVRITHAKQMLRFTDKNVETIGFECGLGQPNYFSRVFKSVESVSPSVYRRQW